VVVNHDASVLKLPGSANQCILGNVYLRSNAPRNTMELLHVIRASQHGCMYVQ